MKNGTFVWDDDQENAFLSPKNALYTVQALLNLQICKSLSRFVRTFSVSA